MSAQGRRVVQQLLRRHSCSAGSAGVAALRGRCHARPAALLPNGATLPGPPQPDPHGYTCRPQPKTGPHFHRPAPDRPDPPLRAGPAAPRCYLRSRGRWRWSCGAGGQRGEVSGREWQKHVATSRTEVAAPSERRLHRCVTSLSNRKHCGGSATACTACIATSALEVELSPRGGAKLELAIDAAMSLHDVLHHMHKGRAACTRQGTTDEQLPSLSLTALCTTASSYQVLHVLMLGLMRGS